MKTNTNTNINTGAGYIAPASAGREARLDQVAGSLDEQSRQVQSLNGEQLAQYRSYGAGVDADITAVQSYGGNGAGATGAPPYDAVAELDQILAEVAAGGGPQSSQQTIAMLQMMIEMLQMMIEMQQQAGGGEQGEGDQGIPEDEGGGGADGPDGPSDTGETDPAQQDEKAMTPVRAARILAKYFDLLDTAAGKGEKDNLVTMADLKAVAKNPDVPEELRRAADYVVKNPMVANALDVGNKTDEVDGKFGLKDFTRFVEEHQGKEGYDTPVPGEGEGPEGPTAPEDPADPEGPPTDPEGPTDPEEPVGPTPTPEEPTPNPEAELRARATQLATRLHGAMDGMGTDEGALISVLTNLTNREVALVKDAYQTAYGESLVDKVESDTSGDFRTTLLALLEGNKDESGRVNRDQVQNDAHALHEAADGWGTTESKFIEIFTKRSKAHLAEVSKSYQEIYGESLAAVVESETSGDFQATLLALLG